MSTATLRAAVGVMLFAFLIALPSWPQRGSLLAQTAEITFNLQIEKGRVAQNNRIIRVKQGDAVRLRWSSDRTIVLHLHGYDIETKVEPGTIADMAFTARATGRFPVEEHKP